MKRRLNSILGLALLLPVLGRAENAVPSSTPLPAPSGSAHSAAAALSAALTPVSTFFGIGSSRFTPRLSYRFLRADDILAQPGKFESSIIQAISAGVTVDFGTHWKADYEPSWIFYSNQAFSDTLDHALTLSGTTSYDDWTFQFTQGFATTSQPVIETAAQTESKNFSAGVLANYRLGRRTLLDTGINWSLRLTKVYPDSRDWSTRHSLRYKFSPGLEAGFTVSLGLSDMGDNAKTAYTRPGVQIGWRPSDKLIVDLHGGLEIREGKSRNSDTSSDPIAGILVTYRPFEPTTFRLSHSRSVYPSYFEQLLNRNTASSVGIDQRFLKRFQASATWTRGKAVYIFSQTGANAGRDDTYRSFSGRLGAVAFKKADVAILYQTSGNSSNASGFGFGSTQYGFEVGYRF
ncbi:MAG: hypothetical protein ABIR80_12845 [Opitutaceae bacterium]